MAEFGQLVLTFIVNQRSEDSFSNGTFRLGSPAEKSRAAKKPSFIIIQWNLLIFLPVKFNCGLVDGNHSDNTKNTLAVAQETNARFRFSE